MSSLRHTPELTPYRFQHIKSRTLLLIQNRSAWRGFFSRRDRWSNARSQTWHLRRRRAWGTARRRRAWGIGQPSFGTLGTLSRFSSGLLPNGGEELASFGTLSRFSSGLLPNEGEDLASFGERELLPGGKGGGDGKSGGSSNSTHVEVVDGGDNDVLTMLIVDTTYALDAQFCIMSRVWRWKSDFLSSSRWNRREFRETFFKMDRHFSMKELVCGDPMMRWELIVGCGSVDAARMWVDVIQERKQSPKTLSGGLFLSDVTQSFVRWIAKVSVTPYGTSL